VIWNRLARGMPLGIDATLRYGLGIQGTKPSTL
jgi:cell division protein YceG involved in septum cleavage